MKRFFLVVLVVVGCLARLPAATFGRHRLRAIHRANGQSSPAAEGQKPATAPPIQRQSRFPKTRATFR